nr:NAD+ synthase [Bacteroidia bacterium]
HPKGKDLFNSDYVLVDGKVHDVVHKTLLPNYDVFDEYRYFESNNEFKIVTIKDVKIALTICEDLWNVNDNPLYQINPMDELFKHQPEVMINIAASPFSKYKPEERVKVMQTNVNKYKLPLFYVNLVGAQTQLIFDGGSMVLNQENNVVDTFTLFEEQCRNYKLDINNNTTVITPLQASTQNNNNHIANVHDALVLGIREYFFKQGFKKATLGLSGGIDSAVVLALAAKALGPENVRAVLLPSQYSSTHSIDDALALAKNLGTPYDIINIENTYQTIIDTLNPYFNNLPFDIAEENLQSRSRGVILMALCNKFGYILLNTSNKSELAVGYGTLYGDMCGGISVIGDLYKTEVYELANFINLTEEIIPINSITKAPSAELRHEQKDSDTLPEYEILDAILGLYIELTKSPKEIIALGFEQDLVKRVLRMINTNEWKRAQAPPVLRVSGKAFGPGRRMPIVAKYLN